MPEITGFVHNGISILSQPAPQPMGPLGGVVLGLVGTAPDADPQIPRSKAWRINSPVQAAMLDKTGNERGTLWRAVTEIQKVANVPIYVVIEREETDLEPAAKDYTMTVVSASQAEGGPIQVIVDSSTLLESVSGSAVNSWTAVVGEKSAAVQIYTVGEVNTLTLSQNGTLLVSDLNQGTQITVKGKDLTPAGTVANIIGKVDPDTGRRTGIQALISTDESLTHIAAPGFNHKAVCDALAQMALRISAQPVLDGPSTNDQDAINFSKSLGTVGTGYDLATLVDPFVKVWSAKAKGYVYMSGVPHLLGAAARVNPWEVPGKGRMNVNIDDTQRTIDYNVMDKASGGNLLNRYGITYFAHTSVGGFSVIGNRTLSGRFINKVGLEQAIIRKLIKTADRKMGENLTAEFMQQQCDSLNAWLAQEAAAGALIAAQVYLHPTLNSPEAYLNGEWHIVIAYGGYSPNEHMVFHLREDVGIVKSFLEETL